ncbi:MAG: hypothetical protein KDK00_02540 [Rhodobacteraceae bacterium]|nr:hypothetical protein [Paracoccaceae bacterium]
MTTIETISGYVFTPGDLKVAGRKPGLSAFLRTRNGADFIEATIRSHIGFYDEIVAVYNQCTDATPDILARLAQEFTPKLRLFHYTDRVQPLGSRGHADTPGDHPESMVNYSNFALSRTLFRDVVKLDDDHLAIPTEVAAITKDFRESRADTGVLHCFSGLNIARSKDGRLGIPAFDPVSGGGDIGYFRMTPETCFFHDRRFERFGRGNLKRRFAGYFYWHLKFLKAGDGFGNYELDANPASRFARKRDRFANTRLLELPGAMRDLRPGASERLAALASDKLRLKTARDGAAAGMFPDATLEDALDRLSPGWREVLGLGVAR